VNGCRIVNLVQSHSAAPVFLNRPPVFSWCPGSPRPHAVFLRCDTGGEPGHTRDTPGRTRAHGSQITLRRTSQPSKPSSTPARHYKVYCSLSAKSPKFGSSGCQLVMADCARRDKRNSRFPGRRDQ